MSDIITDTAETYFDSIYTMHINEIVRMPKKELYELMEGYSKAKNKELRDKIKMIISVIKTMSVCYS